ncbi:MAG: diguanylate cyclase, partial [Pseudoflavonifractor sp.]
MVKHISKKWVSILLVILFLLGAMLLFLFDFGNYTDKQLEHKLRYYMQDVLKQSVTTLNGNINSLTYELETQARVFSLRQWTGDEIVTELQQFSENKNATRASIVMPDGQLYSSQFGISTIDAAPCKDDIEREGSFIHMPRFYEPTGEWLIDISTPVLLGDGQSGLLFISYNRDYLKNLFGLSFLKNDFAITLVTADGIVIGRMSERASPIPPGENYLDFHQGPDISFQSGSYESLKADFLANKPGWFECRISGLPYFVFYSPVQISNWYIAVSATNESLQEQAAGFEYMAGLLAIRIICVLLLAILLFFLYSLRERKALEQLKDAYRLALKKSNDLFYEVDLENDTFVDRSRRRNTLFAHPQSMKYSDYIIRYAEFCAPADRPDFLSHFLPPKWTRPSDRRGILANFEYRIISPENAEYWFQCTVLPMLVKSGTIQRMICIGTDITAQKRATKNLQNAARRDGLTLLYNKISSEKQIERFLQNEGKNGHHALLMMDIDFFKSINDQYGHATGDAVIIGFARTLTGLFRRYDILGRIGGDEFVALFTNFTDIEHVKAKAQQINDAVRSAHLPENSGSEPHAASISIGIALFPDDGVTYTQLFSKADHALYDSK